MSPPPIQRLRQLIETRLGLAGEHLPADMLERLHARLAADGMDHRTLTEAATASPVWTDIVERSTVGETYFFRQPDHFAVLAERLRALAAANPMRRIALLSAGCASGEEAWSMAITARRLGLLERVRILGLDLSPSAIAAARQGRYQPWSFRGVEPASLTGHLTKASGGSQVIADPLRAGVRFERANLVHGAPALLKPRSFDLIFWRNSLMYLTPEHRQRVAATLADAARPGALLFVGTAESLRGLTPRWSLAERAPPGVYALCEPGAVALGPQSARATLPPDAAPPAPAAWASGPAPAGVPTQPTADGPANEHTAVPTFGPAGPATPAAAVDLQAALAAHGQTACPDIPARAPSAPGDSLCPPQQASGPAFVGPRAPPVHAPGPGITQSTRRLLDLLDAKRYAEAERLLPTLAGAEDGPMVAAIEAVLALNRGDIGAAQAACAAELVRSPLAPTLHYLLGICAEQTAENRAAITAYERASFLDPTFALASMRLGSLYRKARRWKRARACLLLAMDQFEYDDFTRLRLLGGGFERASLVALCRSELQAIAARGA